MRESIRAAEGRGREGLAPVATVLLGAALVGSVLLLASIGERRGRQGIGALGDRRLRLQDRGSPVQPDGREEDVPILHDVVQPEELRRPPPEPPVLTDEVVPGREK